MKGPFIVFEGLDGAGTTTQLGLLQAWIERTYGRRVYATREPSGGPVGALLQQALRRRVTLDAKTLALLFAADRIDHLNTEVLDRLDAGIPVLCDRYYLSSYAYQLRDLPNRIEWLESLNAEAVRPDLTLLVDAPAEVCMERILASRWTTELFEETERLRAVRENYLALAQQRMSKQEKIDIIDGNRLPETVHTDICERVRPLFK